MPFRKLLKTCDYLAFLYHQPLPGTKVLKSQCSTKGLKKEPKHVLILDEKCCLSHLASRCCKVHPHSSVKGTSAPWNGKEMADSRTGAVIEEMSLEHVVVPQRKGVPPKPQGWRNVKGKQVGIRWRVKRLMWDAQT